MTSGSAAACTLILVELPSFTGTCAKTHSLKLHTIGRQSEPTTFPKLFEVSSLEQSVTKMSLCFWSRSYPVGLSESFFMLECHNIEHHFPKIVSVSDTFYEIQIRENDEVCCPLGWMCNSQNVWIHRTDEIHYYLNLWHCLTNKEML